jgi:hypothetical protein
VSKTQTAGATHKNKGFRVEALSCVRREFIFGSKTSTSRGPNLLTVSNLSRFGGEHVKRCAAGLAAAQSQGMWRPQYRLLGINVRPNPSENRYGRTDHENPLSNPCDVNGNARISPGDGDTGNDVTASGLPRASG